LKNQTTPSPKDIYLDDLQEDIKFLTKEIGILRRLKESSPDQDVKDTISGIIQDELTLINAYRRELS
jgi:hypothetical protein